MIVLVINLIIYFRWLVKKRDVHDETYQKLIYSNPYLMLSSGRQILINR